MQEQKNEMSVREEAIRVWREDETALNKNNKVWITGVIAEEFQFNHSAYGKNYYRTTIDVKRKSGTVDHVPTLVPDTLANNIASDKFKGKYVSVKGEIRSYIRWGEDRKEHIDTYLLPVQSIQFYDEEPSELANINVLYLKATIFKPPLYRKTSLGKRITDLTVTVIRNHDKNNDDLIHCIAWGSIAKITANLEVGDQIWLRGRMQSKEYTKFIDEGVGEKRIAFEVSIMELIEQEEEA